MEKVFRNIIKGQHPKIVAVGKNYGDHVKEMGGSSNPTKPVIFQKNMTSIVPPGTKQLNLYMKGDVHHEIELGFIMKKQAKQVKNVNLEDYVGGYFLAIDMTARTEQAELKKKGFPWEIAKAFDNSLPLSEFVEFDKVKDVNELELDFRINGKVIQNGFTRDMLFKIPQLIEYTSHYITLNPGDLFITGTPSGVGPVRTDDHIEAYLKQEGQVLAEIDTVVNQITPNL